MAYEGFEDIREDEVILSEVPLKITEPTDDRQLVITCSTKSPQQEVKIRSNKTKFQKHKISQPGKPEARWLTHPRTQGARQIFEFDLNASHIEL